MKIRLNFFCAAIMLALLFFAPSLKGQNLPNPLLISSGWQLQDAAKVLQSSDKISQPGFKVNNWYAATVPGTVLTSLINDKVYPEPLYGENNRPDKIPESLARNSYWYRTTFVVPDNYKGKKIWLNFEGINYEANVWVNGKNVGKIKGAFTRGIFEISSLVLPGKLAALAVLITPQPNPGIALEHTIKNGLGKNGGITALDGPTFLCSIGWDWIPGIRDRNTGIWQKVFISATGAVLVKNPLVTSDLKLPDLTKADVSVETTVENVTNLPQNGVLKGSFEGVSFQQSVKLAAHSSQLIYFDPKKFTQLHILHPRLWWPNGYGPQNLYSLQLSFEINKTVSDLHKTSFGIRKITYSVPESENLTVSVNGVRIFCKGGNWGMDEAMKRIPYERLEAEIRMHQLANYTIIRNWVGQSTSEYFYELCDKYGLMLWDEFFQPNPSDGPNPKDIHLYMANVREKILRFRNHPSIAIWCARNEGFPPKEIDDSLRVMMKALEPVRLYQPSSTDGRGVHSGGPYFWRTPREFYTFDESFKTEIGSVSIPTMESIQGMMPAKDWETINDDWAEHDLARGAQAGNLYPKIINDRYGKVLNLADFVRKSQLANYEAFRAMYEGRNAKLFNPSTGVITWMSNPAQPSFVWQLYHHDLEPNASLFATRKACEPQHIQLNEKEGNIQVINNLPVPLNNAKAHLAIYNIDGSIAFQNDYVVNALPYVATDLGMVSWPTALSSIHFIKLELRDATNKLISDNFYWRALPQHPDDLQALNTLPVVTIDAKVTRRTAGDKCFLDITLNNPKSTIALMVHVQLHRNSTNERVLPVYYTDNYISLVPGETKTITIEAARSDLKGDLPLVLVDGWNIAVSPFSSADVVLKLNDNAQVNHWPVTGLPFK